MTRASDSYLYCVLVQLIFDVDSIVQRLVAQTAEDRRRRRRLIAIGARLALEAPVDENASIVGGHGLEIVQTLVVRLQVVLLNVELPESKQSDGNDARKRQPNRQEEMR